MYRWLGGRSPSGQVQLHGWHSAHLEELQRIRECSYLRHCQTVTGSVSPQITLGTVTKKEGSQMVSVLKELHGWLEDLNTREAKTKQKLMRNLRVRWEIFAVVAAYL